VPINFGSIYEKCGNALGSHITPIIIAMDKRIKPIIAEI
jgi:hypothetical protein